MEPSLKSEVLMKQFPMHDPAAAGLMAAMGASWAHEGDLARGLAYLCHAQYRNPTQTDYPRAISVIRHEMSSRSVASDCPPDRPTAEFLIELPPSY